MAQFTLPILEENPYAGHPELTPLESDVLWEYAKMAALVKQLAATTRSLSNDPANDLLANLRVVENQMGLVLTLFKASVWSTIVSSEAEADQTPSQQPSGISRRSTLPADASSGQDDSYYSDDITPQPRYR